MVYTIYGLKTIRSQVGVEPSTTTTRDRFRTWVEIADLNLTARVFLRVLRFSSSANLTFTSRSEPGLLTKRNKMERNETKRNGTRDILQGK